ncbi:unnamed protein product [Schistosoma curassoni]|uniref:Uncharacterized protein n=1 Tax=Schistosoma curassoni TaxID=6186 RepID=A0A183JZB7_9TREM|nr:unnamed protein product [Schistosoma curassoni]
MYLHLRVDVHSETWLAVESRARVSSYLVIVSWMYLHPRVDVHSGTRTQYRSFQML